MTKVALVSTENDVAIKLARAIFDTKPGKPGKLHSSETTKICRAQGPIFRIFVVSGSQRKTNCRDSLSVAVRHEI